MDQKWAGVSEATAQRLRNILSEILRESGERELAGGADYRYIETALSDDLLDYANHLVHGDFGYEFPKGASQQYVAAITEIVAPATT